MRVEMEHYWNKVCTILPLNLHFDEGFRKKKVMENVQICSVILIYVQIRINFISR